MIGLSVVYVLIGLWLARASAELINQKNLAKEIMWQGESAKWTNNLWTWMFVVTMPLLWITMPVILLLGLSAKVLNESAVWAAREFANPRNNLKEIEK